jgi:hypothetical protein
VIAGSSFTVLRKDAATSVTVSLAHSNEPVKAAVQKFVTAYNDVVSYIGSQQTSSNNGNADAISRPSCGLRSSLAQTTSVVGTGSIPVAGGGRLHVYPQRPAEFDSAAFETALTTNDDGSADSSRHRQPTARSENWRRSSTCVVRRVAAERPGAPADQVTKLADRIAAGRTPGDRRLAMQREFTAADMAISQLNQSGSSLSSLYS